MKIVWSPLAIERIKEIADYISLDSSVEAQKWVDKTFEKIKILKSTPEIGRIVPALKLNTIRELIHGNYRIIYLLDKNQISILTVRHFKQILPISDFEK